MSITPSASGLPNPYDITAGTPGTYPDTDQGQMYPPVNPSPSVQRIAQMARLRLRDLPRPFMARQICSGVAWRFELPVENIDQTSLAVVLTDTTAAGTTNTTPGRDFQIDYRGGIITFQKAPTQGLLMLASGTYYRDLLPPEMDLYVRTAYIQHTYGYTPQNTAVIDNGSTPQIPPPLSPTTGQPTQYGTPASMPIDEVEEYPISLLVATMALWDMAVGAAQQHDIHTPDGVSIPNSQVFEQITRMIGMLESEYIRLSAALGVGLYRITQSKLRRVSKTTKRLVPIYRDQEYDNLLWPQRSLPPIDVTETLVTYQGVWNTAKAYHQHDLVDYGGQRYLCLQDNTNIDPTKDVDPATGSGYYWAWSTINTGWVGYW